MEALNPRDPRPPEDQSLVCLRAGDGTAHYAARTSLERCQYFLERARRAAYDLDVDDDSLRVLLSLLRYGPEAVPGVGGPLRVKVAIDAAKLGLPLALWSHLEAPAEHPAQDRAEWERYATFGARSGDAAIGLLALLTPEAATAYLQRTGWRNLVVLKVHPEGYGLSEDRPDIVGRFVQLSREMHPYGFPMKFPKKAAEGYNNVLMCTPCALTIRYTS